MSRIHNCKRLLSVLLVCLFCLPYFSLGFLANAEVTADVYVQSISASWYFFNQDNVITEVYPFSDSSPSIGDSYSSKMQFRNVVGYFAFICTFDFADSSLMLGQTYTFEFDINTSQNYIYTYYTPHYLPLPYFYDDYFQVGDPRFYPWQINKAFAEDSLPDDMKQDLQSSSFNSVTHVSFPIFIPSDAKSLRNGNFVSDRLVILSYVTFWGNDDYLLPSTLDITNIRLVPTGATELLYQDKIFQDDVIGSDEDGNESGLKGIFKKISVLPLQIWSIITDLGDRIGEFFSELKDNLIQGIKDLLVPSQDDITKFKDDMDNLLSEHLGVLYEAPSFMVSFIRRLAEFKPLRSDDMNDYYVEFPSKTVYFSSVFSDDFMSESSNGGVALPVIPDNTGDGTFRISFGIFNNKPFSTLYSFYNVFIIFITIIGFCNYSIIKFDKLLEE